MKVLKIDIFNHPLFDKEVEINFLLEGRVSADEKHELLHLFDNYYLNYTYTFTGLNASGKTQLLNSMSFALNLLQAQSINYRIPFMSTDNILNLEHHQEIRFDIYFFENFNHQSSLNCLSTTIKRDTDPLDGQLKYLIIDETLKSRKTTGIRSKKELFNFDNLKNASFHKRNNDEIYLGLSPDVSMMNIFYKKRYFNHLYFKDMIRFTNFNFFSGHGFIPPYITQFLDPSIKNITFHSNKENNDIAVEITFNNKEKKVKLNSISDIHTVLSSGTVKGMNLFMETMITLERGGIIIIDELENHFNREIAATLIKLFLDRTINKNGAILIYSTHYAELLDFLDRNDSIFIVNNLNKINLEKLSKSLNRNDISRSDQFIKGILENTAPNYSAKIELTNFLRSKL